MNKLFLGELMDWLAIGSDSHCVVTKVSQEYLKEYILEEQNYVPFPMVCKEYTNDSKFMVSVDESKFLNSKDYDRTWLIGSDYDGYPSFLLCLDSCENNLSIEAFEVNNFMRGKGMGANVLSILESVAEKYYTHISVSPFDTDAMNFWEHMEYVEGKNGQWIKKL
jgi:hypothetical protein